MHPESGFRTTPNWSEIENMTMKSQFREMTSSSFVLDVAVFLLSSLVTAPHFVSIKLLFLGLRQFFFRKDWPEIQILEIPGNTPLWVLLNIWRLGRVRDTKFGINVSNKMLLDTVKCQDYNFYRFWVLKGKPA